MSAGHPETPRSCLVTGASSGIGAATARALAELGWPVAISGRRADRLATVAREIEQAGVRCFARAFDLSDTKAIDGFFDAAQAELGPIDVLVNNAAVCVPGLLHEVEARDLEFELATNLLAPMLLARRAVASLRERGAGGDLVFISSENVIRPRPYQVGYTATKMGIEGVARALRMELEGTGIRAAIVRPGPTGTEFARDWAPGMVEKLLENWKHWGVQRHLEWMPPESVAQAVVSVITAPPGTHLDLVQLMPEGPPDSGE